MTRTCGVVSAVGEGGGPAVEVGGAVVDAGVTVASGPTELSPGNTGFEYITSEVSIASLFVIRG